MNDEAKKPLLTLSNRHVAGCGVPPHITSQPGQYVGYFENGYGEQTVFIYNRATNEGVLYMGDYNWEKPLEVLDGTCPGLVMSDEESTWLRMCWQAATGIVPRPSLFETFTELLREAQSTNPAVTEKLMGKIDALHLVKVGAPREVSRKNGKHKG